MKYIFLVDFENVNIGGLRGVKSLSAQDEIVLFHSYAEDETARIICDLREGIKYVKITKTGQNALDFQLSGYLGYIINQEKIEETQFVIVSKDMGFDCVIAFWTTSMFAKTLNIIPKITRAPCIHDALFPSEPPSQPVITDPPPSAAVSKHDYLEKVDELMKIAMDMSDFHSILIKKFGPQLGKVLYNENKPRFRQHLKRRIAAIPPAPKAPEITPPPEPLPKKYLMKIKIKTH